MQSAHTRMRRAVETENREIETTMGGDRHQSSRRSSSTNKGNNRSYKRRRKPINLCLLLIVLSPLVVIGALVFGVRYYAAVSVEIETMQAQGTAAIAKLKRLRNGQAGGQYPEEREREERRQGSDDGEEVANRKDSSLDDNSNDNSNENNSNSNSNSGSNDNDEPLLLNNNNKNKNNNNNMMKNTGGEFLILLTEHHGNIRIRLRPDLSAESVDYVHRLVESYDPKTNGGSGNGNGRCIHCNFYRADKPGILQGIMAHEGVVPVNTVRGNCPDGAETVPNDCPEWDPDCGCHGPVMKRGAVAWAAGEAGGPDFFIDAYPTPAEWWGTQHTNFGSIDADDHESLAVVDAIFGLPIESTPQMDLLKTPIHFDLALESE